MFNVGTYAIVLLAVVVNVLTSSAKIKKEDSSDEYRLPSNIIPSEYSINLHLGPDVFKYNTFNGDVNIWFTTTSSTNKIKLHARYLNISSISLSDFSTNKSIPINSGPYVPNSATDILKIQTHTPLQPNINYVLKAQYEGTLSETSMSGFYKSSYQEKDSVKYLATTQFEPTSAREAFPCFDEPKFKSRFSISLTFPVGYKANANTPIEKQLVSQDGKLQTVVFEKSPFMSTYLVAFIVSEFECANGTSVGKIPTRVCSRPSAQDNVELALEVAPKILSQMENYTGYAYEKSNIGKLDQLAIPDFSAGAMENWGLVTFREDALLWDKNESSNIFRQRVIIVVAHELSHQWFGNVVTLDWWADIFLKEGFAAYFEYHAADNEYPELDLQNQFVVNYVQTALSADSSKDSQPLSFYVDVPEKIADRFNEISYSKGGSILRMVEHLLTLQNFKAGLHDLIKNKAFNNIEPTDLWKSFDTYAENLPSPQKPPIIFSKIMEKWTLEPGYPLLTVQIQGNDVVISQERFLTSASDKESAPKWYVPISYTLSGEENQNTNTRTWLTPYEDLILSGVLNNSEWIILNNRQTGFYRVNYGNDLRQKISVALQKSNNDGIDDIQRSQIVDDLFNLAKANKLSYEEIFQTMSYLKNELSYYPWDSALNGFSYLLKRSSIKIRDSLEDYILSLLKKLYNSTPFSKTDSSNHIYTLKQILALNWACQLNDEDCVTNAQKQFKAYQDSNLRPDKNLRSVVYCYGIRSSNDAKKSWDFLWEKYLNTQLASEQRTILTALGCASDENLLNDYLWRTIVNNSRVRIQDAKIVVSSIYAGPNKNGVDIVFDFIVKNYSQFNLHFGGTKTIRSLIDSLADRFTSQSQINKLSEFGKTEGLDEDIKGSIEETLIKAQSDLKESEEIEKQLLHYFSSGASDFSHINIFVMLISIIVTVFTIHY